MDGFLRDILRRARTLAWGRVDAVTDVGDGFEVDLTLRPTDEQVTAELAVGAGGRGGGLVRRPVTGDVALVGLVDGSTNDAVVITWVHIGAMPGPDGVDPGGVYLVAPTGELLELRTDAASQVMGVDGSVSIDNDAGAGFELTAAGRVALGNNVGDVLDQLSKGISKAEKICQHAASAVTTTALGPQPLSSVPLFTALQIELIAIRTIVDLIRKS